MPANSQYFVDLTANDPEIAQEITGDTRVSNESRGGADEYMFETIVLEKGRPVLDIKSGAAVLDINEVESMVWKNRLQNAVPLLAPQIPPVGRIELKNHPRGAEWIGTGWLIRDNFVVTNRHVAEVFGHHDGADFVFRPGFDGGSMEASIDFLEEFGSQANLEFPLLKIVHIEDGGGPDLAFLRVEPVDGQTLPKPVKVASASAAENDRVAVVGYPARDPFFPKPDVMDRIFNHRYDKKRLAPGLIIGKSSTRIFHDCTTLGGNSGGQVVSLETGEAVALHFAGTLFKKNHAVPIEIVNEALDDIIAGRRRVRRRSPIETQQANLQSNPPVVSRISRVVEATIPIHVRVEIGDVAAANGSSTANQPTDVDFDEVDLTEAKPEDFLDRGGYQPDFLGAEFSVPFPELTANSDDTLTFQFNGKTREILDYRHFSVLMSKSRRLCRYSACNIDGKTSKRTDRKGWRFDPRIPKSAQIMKECYGNPPKFSRGHMTRREDPAWGSADVAHQGNVDSMNVPNAVPQMQPFNGGVWLSLEDYALQNARKDDMRISVFTGPFFNDEDPIRFGVKIPVRFWKVIAFIHDETKKLTATGYTMSQEGALQEEEFVFSQHRNSQTSITAIQVESGLSFGKLASIDPAERRARELCGRTVESFADSLALSHSRRARLPQPGSFCLIFFNTSHGASQWANATFTSAVGILNTSPSRADAKRTFTH